MTNGFRVFPLSCDAIIHRSIMPSDLLTSSEATRGTNYRRRLDIELEGCGLVAVAGGYLCSIQSTCITIINK